jgi:hypothetical protein
MEHIIPSKSFGNLTGKTRNSFIFSLAALIPTTSPHVIPGSTCTSAPIKHVKNKCTCYSKSNGHNVYY